MISRVFDGSETSLIFVRLCLLASRGTQLQITNCEHLSIKSLSGAMFFFFYREASVSTNESFTLMEKSSASTEVPCITFELCPSIGMIGS